MARLLNLVYRLRTEGLAKDDVAEFDEMLAEAAIAYDAYLTGGNPAREDDKPPSWWGTDEQVDAEMAALARRLTGGTPA